MKKVINIIYLILNIVPFLLKTILTSLVCAIAMIIAGVISMLVGLYAFGGGIICVVNMPDYWFVAAVLMIIGVMLVIWGACFVAGTFAFGGFFLHVLEGYSLVSLLTLVYEIFAPKNWIPIPVCFFSLGDIVIYVIEFIICVWAMFVEENSAVLIAFGTVALADVCGIVISAAIFVFNVVYFIVSVKNNKKKAEICTE